MSYTSIRPGKPWKDTNGKRIQAHGFSVFYDDKNKRYIWYGENKEYTKKGGSIWTYGIRYYTSKDLYNWEDQGLLIPPSEDLNDPLHSTYCVDRPHILYCKKTKKYVCWIKVMAGEVAQFMTILTADRFEGPYTYVHRFYNPLKMYCGDFALHADPDTGKGYIWFERPHFQLICATLSEDYTETTGEYSVHYDGLIPPFTREAPTYFEHNGNRYLFTSGTSGYFPNESKVCVFDDPHGEYKDLGDPFVGDRYHTSFSSQITCVLKIPGSNQLIACADRWKPGMMANLLSSVIVKGMKTHFKEYEPDLTDKEITAVTGKLNTHQDNTWKSDYVWLPIEWEGEKPVIRWRKEWSL